MDNGVERCRELEKIVAEVGWPNLRDFYLEILRKEGFQDTEDLKAFLEKIKKQKEEGLSTEYSCC